MLYLAFVRSRLDYASEVWSHQSIYQVRAIESIQRRATCFILGENPRCSTIIYKERLLKLNLLPISYRHEIKDMVFLHSCLIDKNNLDLSCVLKKSTCTRTCRSDSLTFRIPIFKTKLFQFSYFIRSVKLWNSLPFDITSGRNMLFLWLANARDVRLYFPYRQFTKHMYTNLSISLFVSEHCLRSTLRLLWIGMLVVSTARCFAA